MDSNLEWFNGFSDSMDFYVNSMGIYIFNYNCDLLFIIPS